LGDVEPGEFERNPGPDPREAVPLDGSPLWPARSADPVTVSYVEPSWDDRPTHTWPAERETERETDPHHDGSLGTLGLVTVTGRRPMRPPAPPRPARRPHSSPVKGLFALVLCAFAAAFLAWVTAEPLWLAVGHSTPGTVTVTACDGDGIGRRCVGVFTGADGGFTRTRVPVMGDRPARTTGAPARMTSAGGTRAYVDVDAGGRAATGVALILLCGLVITRATGVRRLPAGRARAVATTLAFAGPLALLTAMLALTH
jgi:hypothetical protein